MKLVNNSKNNYVYRIDNRNQYLLRVGETIEVPEYVAKCFLNNKGVTEVVEQVHEIEEQPKKTSYYKKKTTKKAK